MGNCITTTKDPSTHWGGENWDEYHKSNNKPDRCVCVQEEESIVCDFKLNREHDDDDVTSRTNSCSSSSAITTRRSTREMIKIRVSKKQLEQLVMMRKSGFDLEQALAHQSLAMNGGGDCLIEVNQRRWRPVLGSIPE